MTHDGSEPRAHDAAPLEAREHVVAEVGAAKRAAHDLADVDDARDLAGGAHADEPAATPLVACVLEETAELGACRRRFRPRPVQRAAAPRNREKLGLICDRRLT